MKHIHSEFIAEAMQNTDRKIQGRLIDTLVWEAFELECIFNLPDLWEFRFVATHGSSLGDDAISAIWDKARNSNAGAYRDIADAAAVKEREDICKHNPNDFSSLSIFLTNLAEGLI